MDAPWPAMRNPGGSPKVKSKPLSNWSRRSALYRTMLAELYFDLKFHRRAQAELDRALELNPNDANALRLLRKIKKLSKVGEQQKGYSCFH